MVHDLLENPSKTSRPLVLALHSQMDYAREGLVAYTFVNGQSSIVSQAIIRIRRGSPLCLDPSVCGRW